MIKNPDMFDKLYIFCIENKLTYIIRHKKSITATIKKLKEVYTDL